MFYQVEKSLFSKSQRTGQCHRAFAYYCGKWGELVDEKVENHWCLWKKWAKLFEHPYANNVALMTFLAFCYDFFFLVYMTLTANPGTVTGILMMKRFSFNTRRPSTLSVTYVTRSYTQVLVWPSTVCRYICHWVFCVYMQYVYCMS